MNESEKINFFINKVYECRQIAFSKGLTIDIIIIHSSNEKFICDQIFNGLHLPFSPPEYGTITHMFGIKIIWTKDINENEIICSYNIENENIYNNTAK